MCKIKIEAMYEETVINKLFKLVMYNIWHKWKSLEV